MGTFLSFISKKMRYLKLLVVGDFTLADYIVRGTIMPQLSEEILNHMATGGMPVSVALDIAADGGFTMNFT